MDMPRLIFDHVLEYVFEERVACYTANSAESAQREPFYHDLHAQKLHIPSRVCHQFIDHDIEIVVDLIELAEFAHKIPVKDLNVTAFIYNLSASIEFRIEPWNGLCDLSR